MWLTPSEPVADISSEELAELRGRLVRQNAVFMEIARLMDEALHKPAWPIDACVRVRRLAWDHMEETSCT